MNFLGSLRSVTHLAVSRVKLNFYIHIRNRGRALAHVDRRHAAFFILVSSFVVRGLLNPPGQESNFQTDSTGKSNPSHVVIPCHEFLRNLLFPSDKRFMS